MAQPKVTAASDQQVDELIDEGCRRLRAMQTRKPAYAVVIGQILEEKGVELKYHTLRNRFLGLTKSRKQAHIGQQLLTPEAEEVLVDWILFYSAISNPLSRKRIRSKVHLICGKTPTYGWIRTFLLRWPAIKLGKPCGLDPKRASAFNKPSVTRHCAGLDAIISHFAIPPENLYNCDEKGNQMGGGRKKSPEKFFVPRDRRPKYRTRSDNLELVTIIECVCADGSSLLPGFVFSGKEFCQEWFDHTEDGELFFAVSENGWTDDFIGGEWFKQSFVPQAQARNKSGKPILLILDGHGSHETIVMIDYAIEYGIIIVCLPPHTTHKLQPLDVGVFGPFSIAWAKRCDEITNDTGKGMRKEDFVKEYMQVRKETFTVSIIRQAFRKSAAWPVDQTVFTDEDYAPSHLTSITMGHVPTSYPAQSELSPPDQQASANLEDTPALPAEVPSTVRANGEDIEQDEQDDEEDEGDEEDEDLDIRVSLPASAERAAEVIRDPLGLLPELDALIRSLSLPTSPTSPNDICSNDAMAQDSFPASSSVLPPSAAVSMVPPLSYTQELESRVAELEAENLKLRAHCTLGHDELVSAKRKIAGREETARKRPKISTDGIRCLTTTAGRALAQAKAATRLANEQKKKATEERKKAKAAETLRHRQERDRDTPFMRLLTAMKKVELLQVADAVQIPANEKMKNQDILDLINAFFDSHPEKKSDHLYEGLFVGGSRRRPRVDENTAHPPSSTSELSSSIRAPDNLPPNALPSSTTQRLPLADMSYNNANPPLQSTHHGNPPFHVYNHHPPYAPSTILPYHGHGNAPYLYPPYNPPYPPGFS